MKKFNFIVYFITSLIIFTSNLLFAQTDIAEQNFNEIMDNQNKINNQSNYGNYSDEIDQKAEANRYIKEKSTVNLNNLKQDAQIKVSIDRYINARQQIKKIRSDNSKIPGPAVILGSSEYSGRITNGSLSLRLKLQVTLGRPGIWKTVPLVGDNVVLVNATVNNRSIPVSRQNLYHVWITKTTGEITIYVDILIPPHGPRGSIEYDFHVAKTPVTVFSCQFPTIGLEPRLNAAIESKSITRYGGTYFRASLRPTTRIHIIGFKDMGNFDRRKAKLYSEILNLVSVEKGTLELFSVIKYTILYGGTKEFLIVLPEKTTLVSADGMGAFRYTLKKLANGRTLLKGETAFPIRKNYEISLRIKKEIPKGGEVFQIPIPECKGIERQSGWIGVEVPGKMELKPEKQSNVQIVDIRQLPHDMHNSAVSPILKAYLYHNEKPLINISAKILPEIEPDTGSIDKVTCHTKITSEGKTISDLRITLRNRLKHSLILKLPEKAGISSALIDNEPINLSKNKDGNIIIPLKRSIGSNKLFPFTISIIMEDNIGSMGIIGYPSLKLPTIDLPISSLKWIVYLPKKNKYSGLKGAINNQNYLGQVFWQRSSNRNDFRQQSFNQGNISINNSETLSSTGAVPVRFKIPKNGIALAYNRYWIEKNKPIKISFSYMRSWLKIPCWMLAIIVLILSILYGLHLYKTKTVPVLLKKITSTIHKKTNKNKNLILNLSWISIGLIITMICITLSNIYLVVIILLGGIITWLYQLKLHDSLKKFLTNMLKAIYSVQKKKKKKEKFIIKKFIIQKSFLFFYLILIIILISQIINFLSILSRPLHG